MARVRELLKIAITRTRRCVFYKGQRPPYLNASRALLQLIAPYYREIAKEKKKGN